MSYSTMSERVRQALLQALQQALPAYDLSEGSPMYRAVVEPTLAVVAEDPLATPAADFIAARMAQEFPSLAAGPGDVRTAVLLEPLQALLDPLQGAIRGVYDGFDLTENASLTMQQAETVGAIFQVYPRLGTFTTGRVRVFFRLAAGAAIPTSAQFRTPDGRVYRPLTQQIFTSEQMARQKVGAEYYVDVDVVAAEAGDAYGAGAGTITSVVGVAGALRCVNLADLAPGERSDTPETLLQRVRQALTDRSPTTRPGIIARLLDGFALRQVEVIGKGDPEMRRDVLTGESSGATVATGVGFFVGGVGVLFSLWEDRRPPGMGGRVQVGDRIDLNFPPFIYPTVTTPEAQHSLHTVAEILFDTRDGTAPTIPSLLLVRLDRAPDMAAPSHPGLPGVLPGVPWVATRQGEIRVGGLPGGIQEPNTPDGRLVLRDEVHLGGFADVWVRPSAHDSGTADFPEVRSSAALLEGEDLQCNGAGERGEATLVHRRITLRLGAVSGTIGVGDAVRGSVSGCLATIASRVGEYATIREARGLPEVGETLTAAGGGTGQVVEVTYGAWEGVAVGDALHILSGEDVGVYRFLRVEGPYAWVDAALTASTQDCMFRVLRESRVDLFLPRTALLPFGSATADDLRTVAGSTTVRSQTNMLSYGVRTGDTLEILEGSDAGTFTITGFASSGGGLAPTLSRPLGSTNSGLRYRVFRASEGVSRPLQRLKVGGVALTDAGGNALGVTVPYAHPVEARAIQGFSGSHAVSTGVSGFVLPDPGGTWLPASDRPASTAEYAGAETCLSDGCSADGETSGVGRIATCSLTEAGVFYISGDLPDEVQALLENVRTWLLSLDTAFGFGDEYLSLVEALFPFIVGEPPSGSVLVMQYEILLPYEMFDGINNTWIALPDIDWRTLFSEATSVGEVLTAFRNGDVRTTTPALGSAKPGDMLVVASGANAGAYPIKRIDRWSLASVGAIVDGEGVRSRAYEVVVVQIDGEFPAAAVSGLAAFFSAGGLGDMAELPAPPAYPGTAMDPDGAYLSPWALVGTTMDWLFQWLARMGFDVPTSWEVGTTYILQTVWQILFTDYRVERPTAPAPVRLYFVEPTSVTAYTHRSPTGWDWDNPSPQTVVLAGLPVTLPLPELEGASLGILVAREARSTVLGSVPAGAGTLAVLHPVLQASLDAPGVFVQFGASAVGQSGSISVESVDAYAGFRLSLTAGVGDALRLLGFYPDGEGDPAVFHSTSTFGGSVALPEVTLTGAPAGFGISLLTFDASVNGEWDVDVGSVAPAETYRTDELAEYVETAINAVLSARSLADRATVTLEDDYRLTVTFTGSSLKAVAFVLPSGGLPLPGLLATLFGENVYTTSRDDTDGELVIQADDLGGLHFSGGGGWDVSYVPDADERDTLQAGIDAYVASGAAADTSALAAALNSLLDSRRADGQVYVQWYGGAGVALSLRSILSGSGDSLTVHHTALTEALLEITEDVSVEGGGGAAGNSSGESAYSTGDTTRESVAPPGATRLWTTSGTRLIEYVVTDDPTAPPKQILLPVPTGDGEVPLSEWPRDLIVEDAVEGGTSSGILFTDDSLPSPFLAGVSRGDTLEIHPQRSVLEPSPMAGEAGGLPDILLCLRTQAGSPHLTLPPALRRNYTLLAPYDEGEALQVGDLLVIEEGADTGTYTVEAVTSDRVTLDRAMSASTAQVHRSGTGASLTLGSEVARISVDDGTLYSSDVGRWLCLWGSHKEGVNGAHRITAVARVYDGAWVWQVTLDWPDGATVADAGLEWVVVSPPPEEPDASALGGTSELLGVVPVRAYRGTGLSWVIGEVTPSPTRTGCRLRVAQGGSGHPNPGVRAPWRIYRPGVYRVSVGQMRGQRERGLYYMDVWAKSLGGGPEYNLPAGERLEAVRGSYASDGYTFVGADDRYTYSVLEETSLSITPFLLPEGAEDRLSSHAAVEGRRLRVSYEWSAAANGAQAWLRSANGKPLCGDILVRLFLPAYVYLDVSYGNTLTPPSRIANALRTHIDGLPSTASLDVSLLQQVAAASGAVSYQNPWVVITVTHDLDRNLVGSRASDIIGDMDVPYHGSDRTTAYIAGPDRSEGTEAVIPPGERTRLAASVARFSR